MKKKLSMLAFGTALTMNVVTAGHVWAQPALTDGEVTKVDASAGKITIKHGPMKKFDMDDGMTMVYRVQDPAMLTTVKAGDKIKFNAEHISGQFIVTKIQGVK
jgi:Cu(I)/Ag(I) efflux system protein CusF